MKTLLVVIMVLGMGFFVANAKAFCVHNNTTDKKMNFKQVGGSLFRLIEPGEKMCKTAGEQDSPVKFNVYYYYHSPYATPLKVVICENFQITAGGDIYATGSNGNYSCSGQ